MRATVTTPDGERREGVTGDLLAYYLSEAETKPGYEIVEEPDEQVTFPRMYDGEHYVDLAPTDAPEVELVSEPAPAADAEQADTGEATADTDPSDPPA